MDSENSDEDETKENIDSDDSTDSTDSGPYYMLSEDAAAYLKRNQEIEDADEEQPRKSKRLRKE
jgi:hypothetical protein